MNVIESKAEVFWIAFKALSHKETQSVVQRLLRDKEFMEDLIDIATIRQRRKESSRPLKHYLAEKAHKGN